MAREPLRQPGFSGISRHFPGSPAFRGSHLPRPLRNKRDLTASGGPASISPMSEASTPNNPPLLTEDDREFLAALLSAPSEPPLLGKGDFYDAEERVLNAFLDGWNERARRGVAGARPVIVLPDGSGIPESPNSKDMQDATLRAGEKATLRASFLRSLFLGSYGSFAPRSVIISRARIEGRLDLDYCKPCFPLMFHECIFSQGISLRAATIPELILIKCFDRS